MFKYERLLYCTYFTHLKVERWVKLRVFKLTFSQMFTVAVTEGIDIYEIRKTLILHIFYQCESWEVRTLNIAPIFNPCKEARKVGAGQPFTVLNIHILTSVCGCPNVKRRQPLVSRACLFIKALHSFFNTMFSEKKILAFFLFLVFVIRI